ncbi:MAG: PIG-L family deacetylase [Candidatus Sungbacteria bacterium]|nr:PIG-L family deacetylase [Candidatus Sungbacteria bacterium]
MKESKKKLFLVFSPHPDDVDFGCAGTVAMLTSQSHTVIYCIVTNGEKGVHKVRQSKHAMVAMREKEQKAAAVAGVKEVIFLRQTDGDLEHTRALRKLITRVIRKVKPDIVLSLDPGNHTFESFYRFHRDHRVTAEVVFDAIYPGVGSEAFFPELAQEDVLPHQIEEVWFFSTDKPNMVINITRTIGKKIEALWQHESQIRDMAVTAANVRRRAKEAGKKKRMPYAESFRRLTF